MNDILDMTGRRATIVSDGRIEIVPPSARTIDRSGPRPSKGPTNATFTGYPKVWDGKVFDRVWQITYDEKGNTKCADLPQRLLPDDSKK